MKTKHIILSTIAAFLVSNIFTSVWYAMMDDANYVPFRRAEINYGLLILNHLIFAGLMVYLFPFVHAKKPGLMDAFSFGAVISAIMFIPQALVVRGIWTVDIDAIFFLNTAIHLVIGGFMGLVIWAIARDRASGTA